MRSTFGMLAQHVLWSHHLHMRNVSTTTRSRWFSKASLSLHIITIKGYIKGSYQIIYYTWNHDIVSLSSTHCGFPDEIFWNNGRRSKDSGAWSTCSLVSVTLAADGHQMLVQVVQQGREFQHGIDKKQMCESRYIATTLDFVYNHIVLISAFSNSLGVRTFFETSPKKIIRSTSTSKVCRLFYIDLSQWFTSRKESIPHWLVIYVIFPSVRSPDSKPFFFFAKWHVPNVPHVEHPSKRRLHLLGPCRINWGQVVWSWLIMSMHASYRIL